MKVRDAYRPDRKFQMSIERLVQYKLDSTHRDGAIENLQAQQQELAEMFARLLEHLSLTDQNVLKIVQAYDLELDVP